MKHKIVLEIDGVRHKLIKTKIKNPCKKCSLRKNCCVKTDPVCGIDPVETRFRKCKPGE